MQEPQRKDPSEAWWKAGIQAGEMLGNFVEEAKKATETYVMGYAKAGELQLMDKKLFEVHLHERRDREGRHLPEAPLHLLRGGPHEVCAADDCEAGLHSAGAA